jgi:hypothetical protein
MNRGNIRVYIYIYISSCSVATNFPTIHVFLSPIYLYITSPTSGGRSVGIVRSRTQTMEFYIYVYIYIYI